MHAFFQNGECNAEPDGVYPSSSMIDCSSFDSNAAWEARIWDGNVDCSGRPILTVQGGNSTGTCIQASYRTGGPSSPLETLWLNVKCSSSIRQAVAAQWLVAVLSLVLAVHFIGDRRGL